MNVIVKTYDENVTAKAGLLRIVACQYESLGLIDDAVGGDGRVM
jgi:hypothetical protein